MKDKDKKNKKDLDQQLKELKWEYQVMLKSLKMKNDQAKDLLKQLKMIMSYYKKLVLEEAKKNNIEVPEEILR